ncbi:MAG: hypothetical protein H0V30_03840 [Chitinophagaceae bacterium]|jgi:hypothetical protein|nr:hypothetical protein [Chitinophagaceae bacterium]
MNRIDETWKVFVNIATLGLYSTEFTFFKRTKKKSVNFSYSTPDSTDIRTRGSNRKKEVSLRCPE